MREDDIPDISAPSDGAYGWICVIASFFIIAFTWGQVSVIDKHTLFFHDSTTTLGVGSYTVYTFPTIYPTIVSQKEVRRILHSSVA